MTRHDSRRTHLGIVPKPEKQKKHLEPEEFWANFHDTIHNLNCSGIFRAGFPYLLCHHHLVSRPKPGGKRSFFICPAKLPPNPHGSTHSTPTQHIAGLLRDIRYDFPFPQVGYVSSLEGIPCTSFFRVVTQTTSCFFSLSGLEIKRVKLLVTSIFGWSILVTNGRNWWVDFGVIFVWYNWTNTISAVLL